MIEIESYVGVNQLNFGETESKGVACFGSPRTKIINHQGEQELNFDSFTLRFDSMSGQFRECTLLPDCKAAINGTPVSWDGAFLLWLGQQDNNLKELTGFVLSLRLGIAVSGFHDGDTSQKAIHAFRRGDWDMFEKRMTPFQALTQPPAN